MLILEQRVFGLPVPQPRAKTRLLPDAAAPLGVRVQRYDPEAAVAWKRTVALQCLGHRPPAPVAGPLRLSMEFYLPRPVSLPKRVLHHVKKPDLDNLAKAIKDALKGVVYMDDSQITEIDARKRYSPAPGVLIRIARVVAPPPTT